MEEFNISSNKLQKLAALKELLQKGVEHIPELQAYLSKIDSIVDEGVSKHSKNSQRPDFPKPGLCYVQKFLYF